MLGFREWYPPCRAPCDLQHCQKLPPPIPLGATSVGAGGTFLAGVPKGPGLAALTAATHAAAPAAAHAPVLRQAGHRRRRAVAVVAHVAWVTVALAAVALPVTWGSKGGGGREGDADTQLNAVLHGERRLRSECRASW